MGDIGDPYITASELKTYLRSNLNGMSSFDDTLIEDAISSVSREVQGYCKRHFNRAETVSTITYRDRAIRKQKSGKYRAFVDDIWTVDGLIVEIDGTVVDDFELLPEGFVDGELGWPFFWIEHDSITASSRVKVTAKWGWAEVPADVREAVKIHAAQTYSIKDTRFGIAGSSEWGAIRIRDNDMANSKLKRYRKQVIQIG